MTVQIMLLPILVVIAVVLAIAVYLKTKSFAKVGLMFEIVIAIAVFVLSFTLPTASNADKSLILVIDLLGAGFLINGLVSLFR